jgi:hypothetical protein
VENFFKLYIHMEKSHEFRRRMVEQKINSDKTRGYFVFLVLWSWMFAVPFCWQRKCAEWLVE